MGGKPSKDVVRKAVRKFQETHREAQRAKKRAAYQANKKTELERLAKKRNTAKGKASAKLRYAVWSGKIKKPNICEQCETYFEDKGKLHGHHHDYTRPFDVQWLCSICHGKSHRID